MNRSDIMEIHLFHMSKASNAQLVLFNCIIHWVKIYEGDII